VKVVVNLLKQLVYQHGVLPPALVKLYDQTKRGKRFDVSALEDVIISCSREFHPVFVFLDGLDECPEE
jgi:hypothetical protein